METKFTPGPWHVELGEFIYVCSSETVCDVTTVVNLAIGQDANANLIAAAPDLYNALNKLVDEFPPCGSDSEFLALNEAIEALAKARGEQ